MYISFIRLVMEHLSNQNTMYYVLCETAYADVALWENATRKKFHRPQHWYNRPTPPCFLFPFLFFTQSFHYSFHQIHTIDTRAPKLHQTEKNKYTNCKTLTSFLFRWTPTNPILLFLFSSIFPQKLIPFTFLLSHCSGFTTCSLAFYSPTLLKFTLFLSDIKNPTFPISHNIRSPFEFNSIDLILIFSILLGII